MMFKRVCAGIGVLLLTGMLGCGRNAPSPEQVSWSQTGGVATSGNYRSVLVADLDGDGHPDIAGGSSDPGKVAIWYGDGSGKMTMPQLLPRDGKVDVRSIAAADFNGDGLMDIVGSVQRESSGIRILINKPGRLWDNGVEPTRVNRYEGIRVGDINRDGHFDVIAANATSETEGGVQVWLGDGTGNWIIETGPTVTGRFMDVAVADFNKDGRPDLAGAAWGEQGGIHVWLGDGTGNWAAMPVMGSGLNFNALSIGDIDQDGNLDILAGTYREGIRLFMGDGTGRFAAVPGPVDTGSYWRPLVIDIDGDGKNDLVAGSVDGKGLRGWLNRGKNRWREAEGIFPSMGAYYDQTPADLDGDDNNELIVAGFGEGIKILSSGDWPRHLALQEIAGGDAAESEGAAFENEVYTTEKGYVEYKVGPGDILQIILWEPDRITREEVEIKAGGQLSFSFIEDIPVTGLTTREVDEILTEQMSAYISRPRIDVEVAYYRSKWVSLLGPGVSHESGGGGWSGERGSRGGRYYLDGRMGLIELLSGSGVSRSANLREILVTRKNGRTLKLNIYKAMTLGDKTQDIIMDNGDSVYVSLISAEGSRVFVFGEVGEPGAYAFTGAGMPLLDAIAAAGGPTVFGKLEHTKIIRGDISKPEVLSVDLEKLVETGDQSQNISLTDGDMVYVPRSAVGDINRFVKRMSPILHMMLAPVRTIDAFDDLDD